MTIRDHIIRAEYPALIRAVYEKHGRGPPGNVCISSDPAGGG
ncbi:hypothetical protein [Methanocalculus taiwanensis]|nr:hypothetical protein [Methanocalculus taiwanensis]